MTHFEIFGLPARYALDLDDLERRYREASRHWHPDRFSRAPASERAEVLKRATDLNQAYRVLKNDARRGEYLLKLRGVDISSEESGKQPAELGLAFLGQVLELREELVEARMSHDEARLRNLQDTIDAHTAELRRDLASGFARLEAGELTALTPLAKTLLMQRYYQRFRDEIAAVMEEHAESRMGAIAHNA